MELTTTTTTTKLIIGSSSVCLHTQRRTKESINIFLTLQGKPVTVSYLLTEEDGEIIKQRTLTLTQHKTLISTMDSNKFRLFVSNAGKMSQNVSLMERLIQWPDHKDQLAKMGDLTFWLQEKDGQLQINCDKITGDIEYSIVFNNTTTTKPMSAKTLFIDLPTQPVDVYIRRVRLMKNVAGSGEVSVRYMDICKEESMKLLVVGSTVVTATSHESKRTSPRITGTIDGNTNVSLKIFNSNSEQCYKRTENHFTIVDDKQSKLAFLAHTECQTTQDTQGVDFPITDDPVQNSQEINIDDCTFWIHADRIDRTEEDYELYVYNTCFPEGKQSGLFRIVIFGPRKGVIVSPNPLGSIPIDIPAKRGDVIKWMVTKLS